MPNPDNALRTLSLVEQAMELNPESRKAYLHARAEGDQKLAEECLRMLRSVEAAEEESATEPRPTPIGPLRLVSSTATAELLKKLHDAARLDDKRFAVRELLGSGGMGKVLRVEDMHLKRTLAMKVPHSHHSSSEQRDPRQSVQLARFLEEAQVTSQLDHPGIVPIHDLGLDPSGQVYFLMRHVQGHDARDAFALARAERDGWTIPRALEVVLKVCDTMAYAHIKGVLHRDLKPENIRVGSYGEVYVMDWGLAKVAQQDDRHDLRLPDTSAIASARTNDAVRNPGSSVVTMDGKVLGTPYYMSPEQAMSQPLDHRTDIYAIGASLYELLTGQPPYHQPGDLPSEVLQQVLIGPPKKIERVNRGVAADMIAIVEKAMARDPDQRYATMTDLANDLRAHLGKRVVSAYRTGAFTELKMWVRRNRLLAGNLAGAAALLVTGIIVTYHNVILARRISTASEISRIQANSDTILKDERALYECRPENIPTLAASEQELQRLLATLPKVRRELARLEGSASGNTLDAAGQFDLRALRTTTHRIEALNQKSKSPLGTNVQRLLRWARSQRDASFRNPNTESSWGSTREAIATSPIYKNAVDLNEEDMLGLVPLGENPNTGYFEFYHLRSAWDGIIDPMNIEIPKRNEAGWIETTESTGIVFVLLPGGQVDLGTQCTDPGKPLYISKEAPFLSGEDKAAIETEERLHRVDLAPFFMAAHELTQGQCSRLRLFADTDRNPSQFHPGNESPQWAPITLAHPAESMTWTMSNER